MPRCNLTLRQKCQILELSGDLSTEQIAKKFHVHPTTVTRTIQKKKKILEHASRVNVNFKTVQTNQRGEEHDRLVLEFIKARQEANDPITIKEICDKAVEFADTLERTIKSKRGWWRRFKVRCNVVKSRMLKSKASPNVTITENSTTPKEEVTPTDNNGSGISDTGDIEVKKKKKTSRESKKSKQQASKVKRKGYTFRIKELGIASTPKIVAKKSPPPKEAASVEQEKPKKARKTKSAPASKPKKKQTKSKT